MFKIEDIPKKFKEWLKRDGLYGNLHEYSHTILALHEGINLLVRESEVEWFPNSFQWPDDYWIIGEDGAGNFYFISKQSEDQEVYFYNHETLEKEDFEPSIEHYYKYCKSIEVESDEQVQQIELIAEMQPDSLEYDK